MRAISLAYRFLTDDSLQPQTNVIKKAVLWQGNRVYDAVVKVDSSLTYQNLQRHRAVLPAIRPIAIAQLSLFFV